MQIKCYYFVPVQSDGKISDAYPIQFQLKSTVLTSNKVGNFLDFRYIAKYLVLLKMIIPILYKI